MLFKKTTTNKGTSIYSYSKELYLRYIEINEFFLQYIYIYCKSFLQQHKKKQRGLKHLLGWDLEK